MEIAMEYQSTAHAHLMLHHSRHRYAKGQFKGDAPADPDRRAKSHFRVTHHPHTNSYAVRFHYTDILTAYPDGSVVLNCNGWASHPTTRLAMRAAFGITNMPFYLSSARLGGLSQPVLYAQGRKPLRYYDGMMFDPQGNLTTPPKPFQKQVTNRDETREFREAAKTFRAMLPILHAACEEPSYHPRRPWQMDSRTLQMRNRPEDIFDRYDEDAYPDIVAAFYAGTWRETWRNLYSAAAARMKTTIDIEEIQE
jgi:hypothetical protein